MVLPYPTSTWRSDNLPSDELEGDTGSDADGEAVVLSIGKSF